MPENDLKKTDWLATVFYPLSVILMEAFWVSPWLNWVGTWPFFREQRPILNLVSIIVLLTVSLLVTRLTARQKWPMWAVQAVIIGAGMIALFLVIAVEYTDGYTFLSGAWFSHLGRLFAEAFSNMSTAIIALPVIIYLWWRGIMLGQSTSFFKDIYRSFLIGMAALIILIIIWQSGALAVKSASPGSGLGFNVIAFFFFGLLSVAICHLYVMRSTMPKEDAALTSVWRWMPVMLGIIGGLVLVGFLIASIFSPDMMSAIGTGLTAIGNALGQLLEWILVPVVYLVQGLLWVFRWFLMLFKQEDNGDTQNMTAGGAPEFGDINGTDTPEWLGVLFKWIVGVIVVGLVIFILAKAVSKYRAKKAREETDEVSESLFSWKGLRDDLKEMLNSLGNRFRKKPSAPASDFDPDAAGRLNIREIFKRLQWEGHKSGITRRRQETAAEYARRLERAVPDSVDAIQPARDSIGSIKDLYESVRYGETEPPEPAVDKANTLWQKVKTMLRRIRGES
jgi:hypothetical protein